MNTCTYALHSAEWGLCNVFLDSPSSPIIPVTTLYIIGNICTVHCSTLQSEIAILCCGTVKVCQKKDLIESNTRIYTIHYITLHYTLHYRKYMHSALQYAPVRNSNTMLWYSKRSFPLKSLPKKRIWYKVISGSTLYITLHYFIHYIIGNVFTVRCSTLQSEMAIQYCCGTVKGHCQ